jgi:spore coat assembly protein
MNTFNIGDVVARKSYNLDILFKVVSINKDIVDLAGLTVRIVADAPISDLVHISEVELKDRMSRIEDSRRTRMSRCYANINKKFNIRDTTTENPNIYTKDKIFKKPGVILHIDGDAEYTEKCRESYKKMGLTAYVYNISEEEQYKQVYSLLQKIRPNILKAFRGFFLSNIKTPTLFFSYLVLFPK